MKSIKIAPDLNEVAQTKNVVCTVFNGMKIAYTMPEDRYMEMNSMEVRQALREGIALSSKLWFLEDLLNRHFGWNGKLRVTSERTGEVLYN